MVLRRQQLIKVLQAALLLICCMSLNLYAPEDTGVGEDVPPDTVEPSPEASPTETPTEEVELTPEQRATIDARTSACMNESYYVDFTQTWFKLNESETPAKFRKIPEKDGEFVEPLEGADPRVVGPYLLQLLASCIYCKRGDEPALDPDECRNSVTNRFQLQRLHDEADTSTLEEIANIVKDTPGVVRDVVDFYQATQTIADMLSGKFGEEEVPENPEEPAFGVPIQPFMPAQPMTGGPPSKPSAPPVDQASRAGAKDKQEGFLGFDEKDKKKPPSEERKKTDDKKVAARAKPSAPKIPKVVGGGGAPGGQAVIVTEGDQPAYQYQARDVRVPFETGTADTGDALESQLIDELLSEDGGRGIPSRLEGRQPAEGEAAPQEATGIYLLLERIRFTHVKVLSEEYLEE